MRTTRSRTVNWLVAALALWGCSFDPTRRCDSDGDCTNGGTCDPSTKTCVAAGDPNDRTPPTFQILVSAAPVRQDTANLKVIDPGSPDGGVGVFRRDESVRVSLVSDDTDVLLSSVTLTVQGVASGGDPGMGLAFGSCGAGSPGAGRAFCVGLELPLGPLIPFETFRGPVRFTAGGSDRSGNAATPVTTSVDVTRWKWRYAAGLPIRTTPAIADDGTVVFGTSNGTTGSLHALGPEGSQRWLPIALGPIEASPAIGELAGKQQLLYVGTASRPSTLYAFSVADGSPGGSCLGSTNTRPGGEMWGSPALSTSSGVGGPYESATAFASAQQLVTLRPSAVAPDPSCVSLLSSGTQATGETMNAVGSNLYFGASDGTVRAFVFESGVWAKNIVWGAGAGAVFVADTPVGPLLLAAQVLGATKLRGAFALDPPSGSLLANAPDGGVQSDPGGLSLSTSGVLFTDGASPAPAIFSAKSDLTDPVRVPLTGAGSVSTIALGSAGLRYLLTLDGHLEAHQPSLALGWSEALDVAAFEASATIDCFRNAGAPAHAGTGVLYAASTGGSLFAVVVDDPGLDTTAPWPKYQHDVRNTGNPGTVLRACP